MAAPVRDQKSTGCAECGQDETFGEKLLQQTHAAGANRETNAHLVATGERADQQQIAHVRTGDKQNKSNDGYHDFECRQHSSSMVERRLPQGPYPDAAPTVGGRVTRLQSRSNCRDFLLGLRATDSGLEPDEGLKPTLVTLCE